MTLDQYQLCPCGSGKKIKFCCSRDFFHDLDRIARMIQGDQRLAALEKIDALLERYPDRPSLLMMKLELQLHLNEPEKYRATLARLVEVDPRNPSVLAMQSMVALLSERDLNKAVNLLQDAFELVDSNVGTRVFEALLAISMMLNRIGYAVAAKGHLQMAVALSDAKDERCSQALMQLNHARQIPLIMREPLSLYSCPPNVTWRIEFDATMRDVYRGRWRRGSRQLGLMAIRILDAPAILYNQGVVSAWLGDNVNAVKALRDFARIREVPLDDRVDALALVEYLDVSPERLVELKSYTFDVDSLDPILERGLSHPRLRSVPVERMQVPEGEPAPRALLTVVDRPFPSKTTEFQPEDIPRLLGEIALYGKQTDRSARMVISGETTNYQPLAEIAAELLGHELGATAHEEVVSHQRWLDAAVFGHYAWPEGVRPDEQRRLREILHQQALTERFPHTPCPTLDGKTPTEAAQDSKYKVPLLAMLLNIELAADHDIDMNSLRRQLNLPEREPLDPATCDCERLPVHRLSQIDVSKLSDDQLLVVYRRAYSVMAVVPLRKIALELIGRPSLDDRIDKVEAYDILSDVADNSDEALEYLDKARKLATAEGESPAAWLIDELEIRLVRGEFDKFGQLIKEIQARYMKEPGIPQALIQVLARYGLVTPDGRVVVPVTRGEEPAEAAVAAGVWTPESGSGAEGPKSEPKIWLPGMD